MSEDYEEITPLEDINLEEYDNEVRTYILKTKLIENSYLLYDRLINELFKLSSCDFKEVLDEAYSRLKKDMRFYSRRNIHPDELSHLKKVIETIEKLNDMQRIIINREMTIKQKE